MADLKFSGATAITTPLATDEIPFARSGTSNKITVANIAKRMPGYQFDYSQITSDGTSAATSAAAAGTIITGNSVTYDGATQVRVVVFARSWTSTLNTVSSIATVWRDSTDLGIVCLRQTDAAGNIFSSVLYGEVYDTPPSGAAVYLLKAYNGSAATTTVKAGAGGSGVSVPAFLRVVRV